MYIRKKIAALFRKKLQFFLKYVIIISFIFVLYQLVIFFQLSRVMKKEPTSNLVLGTHEFQKTFFKPNENGEFTCITSMEKIDFSQVNDDYCDCLDGTDEPGTNACANSQFFCTIQVGNNQYAKLVASSMVNDGVCDCCDGSDEWQHKKLTFRLEDGMQAVLRRYQSPCQDVCPK